ncbi:VCBS repeat-containing protein [Balamuthia mandrillaris]
MVDRLHHAKLLLFLLCLVGLSLEQVSAGDCPTTFPSAVNVTLPLDADLPGEGFRLFSDLSIRLGSRVQGIGDFNGDGLNDFVVSCARPQFTKIAKLGGIVPSGLAWIVYGREEHPEGDLLDLDQLNGSDGVLLVPMNEDLEREDYPFGQFMEPAGDFNGDDFKDLIISDAAYGYPGISGRIFVVYGTDKPFENGMLFMSDLNGTNGFMIDAKTDGYYLGRHLGFLRDVNGDGYDDVGFTNANTDVYVLFGREEAIADGYLGLQDVANGENGLLVINSEDAESRKRKKLSRQVRVTDLDADSLPDLLFEVDETFMGVIFGKNQKTLYSDTQLDVASLGADDMLLLTSTGVSTGYYNPGGDFNGDGRRDTLIHTLDNNAYILFGSPEWNDGRGSFNLATDLDDETIGIRITSAQYVIHPSENAIVSAGDWNGDGYDDVLVRLLHDTFTGGVGSQGAAFLVFGSANPPAAIVLENMDEQQGILFWGTLSSGHLGSSVSAVYDFNGDNAHDIVLGEPSTFKMDEPSSFGYAYVLYGCGVAASDGDGADGGDGEDGGDGSDGGPADRMQPLFSSLTIHALKTTFFLRDCHSR